MQSRRGWIWLALLPVVGRGQKAISGDCSTMSDTCRKVTLDLPAWRDGKALPNQCPTCGTMAKSVSFDDIDHLVCVADHGSVPCARTVTSQLTRCLRCNAAFWQDAQ